MRVYYKKVIQMPTMKKESKKYVSKEIRKIPYSQKMTLRNFQPGVWVEIKVMEDQ